MKYKNIAILGFYVFLALLLTAYILGFKNLSFVNTDWLAARDVSTDLISWKFFKTDIWRFPLGGNPNYGLDVASGIAFSGSIPIMALIFKLFANILPDNFHYFGLWIFICFFLQSYIAFIIIYNKTESLFFSIIGSLFFLLSPILINRIGLHLSLSAHWLILLGFYIETKKESFNKYIYWAALISLSSLIHFYFTIMLLGLFFLFLFFKINKKTDYKNFFKQIFLILCSLTFTMFVIGYFNVPFTDALAYGYGDYALDIFSIFSNNTPSVSGKINWSFLMPNTEMLGHESFAYLGLGGIILLIFLIVIFISNYNIFIKNKKFYPYLLIILIFSIIAISNKIHLFGDQIFSYELPKVIYGVLSVVRASGRLFWPVYYLVFLGSIIFLYKTFSKKNSLYILVIVFFLQLLDIHQGLKESFNANSFLTIKKITDNSYWKNITKKNPTLRTTHLNNETKFTTQLREVLLSKNIKRTDISTHGRYNRKQASISRSNLYKSFDQKQFPKNTIFAIDSLNHLRNLKYIYEKENIGFFFRNNVWIAIANYKNQMSENDKKLFKIYDPITLKENSKINFNFYDINSIHGFGWTHSNLLNNLGIWTEGNLSTLFFKIDESVSEKLIIKIKLKSLIIKNNESINFDLNINNSLIKKFNLKNVNELKEDSISIKINKNKIKDDIVYIKFIINNPVTKLELLQSPDARKLGILVESLELINDQ